MFVLWIFSNSWNSAQNIPYGVKMIFSDIFDSLGGDFHSVPSYLMNLMPSWCVCFWIPLIQSFISLAEQTMSVLLLDIFLKYENLCASSYENATTQMACSYFPIPIWSARIEPSGVSGISLGFGNEIFFPLTFCFQSNKLFSQVICHNDFADKEVWDSQSRMKEILCAWCGSRLVLMILFEG